MKVENPEKGVKGKEESEKAVLVPGDIKKKTRNV